LQDGQNGGVKRVGINHTPATQRPYCKQRTGPI